MIFFHFFLLSWITSGLRFLTHNCIKEYLLTCVFSFELSVVFLKKMSAILVTFWNAKRHICNNENWHAVLINLLLLQYNAILMHWQFSRVFDNDSQNAYGLQLNKLGQLFKFGPFVSEKAANLWELNSILASSWGTRSILRLSEGA